MKRTHGRCVAAAACAVLLGWTAAARPTAAGDVDAREHLAQERRSIEAAHLERERQCAAQFVVTACAEAARAQRREALAALAARDAALDDAERRQRALDRQARIDEKVARQAASAPDRELVPLVPAEEVSRTRAAPAPSGASRPTAPRAERLSPQEVGAREAESRDHFDQRAREAVDRRRAAVARQVERDRAGKPAAAALPALRSSGAGSR